MSKKNTGYWFSVRDADMWIPDAFVGPMASLLRAIEDDSVPASGGSVLKIVQVVFAECLSIKERTRRQPQRDYSLRKHNPSLLKKRV